jgi:hypothetical protein
VCARACVYVCVERERERERPELVEDMAANGDGLDIFNNGLEIFVADRANGLGKGGATDHISLSLSVLSALVLLSPVPLSLWLISGKNGAKYEICLSGKKRENG